MSRLGLLALLFCSGLHAQSSAIDATAATTHPAWIDSSLPNAGYWVEVSTNTIDDVKTTDEWAGYDIFNAWVGGGGLQSYGASGSLIAGMGGGHSAYGGTDVFVFDVATRAISEVHADTSGGSRTGNSFGEFGNGEPVPWHTYSKALGDQWRHELFVPMGVSDSANQTLDVAVAYGHAYSPQLDEYRRLPQTPNFVANGGFGVASCSAWDQKRRGVWYVGYIGSLSAVRLAFYSSVYDTWTAYKAYYTAFDIEGSCAVDPVRGYLTILDGRDTNNVAVIDLNDMSNVATDWGTAYQPCNATLAGTSVDPQGGSGWQWSPDRLSFIQLSHSTEDVYEYVPSGSDPCSYTLTRALLTDASNSVTPAQEVGIPSDGNMGPFTRFQLIHFGDGVDVVFKWARENDGIYAMKLP